MLHLVQTLHAALISLSGPVCHLSDYVGDRRFRKYMWLFDCITSVNSWSVHIIQYVLVSPILMTIQTSTAMLLFSALIKSWWGKKDSWPREMSRGSTSCSDWRFPVELNNKSVLSFPLFSLSLSAVLLAVCALQGTGGDRRVQLLLHLSHHHRRPVH